MDNCIFCQIAAKKSDAEILYEDDDLVVFSDNNPQAPVHVLTIPRRHIAKVSDLTPGDENLIGKMILAARNQAKELGISDSGFRLVFNNGREGGQQVFHIHLHLLGGRPMHWPPG